MNENSFLDSIDTHNIANGDSSWFSRKMNTTGEFFGDVGDAITKGAPGAIVAGINSLLNTGIALANFAGANVKEIDTYQVLKGFDDDLGKYYQQHSEGVELAGFALGAFVPGMAGVKALSAAKAGYLGKNMLSSTGLMGTVTRDYATAAKIEMASGTSPFSLFEANTAKALIQGFGSQALDALAFELAATAVMYKSPVLKEQTATDLFWNIATGTLLGGGIGGVLHGVGITSSIKRAAEGIDKELFPYKVIYGLPDTATSDTKILNYMQQKFNMPEAQLGENIKTQLTADDRMKLITENRTKTLDRLDNLIQQEFNKFAGNDILVGQRMYDSIKNIDNFQDAAAALLHAKGISRITDNETIVFGETIFPKHGMKPLEFEDFLIKGNKNELFTPEATGNTQGFRLIGDSSQLKITGYGKDSQFGNAATAFDAGYDIYRNSNGTFSVNAKSQIIQATNKVRTANNLVVDLENGAAIVDKGTPGLADLATKENPVVVRGDTVLYGKNNPLKVVDGSKFDPTAENYLEVQARYIWAQEQTIKNWKNQVIHENDLPMLEKAYYAGDEAKGFGIRLEDGTTSLAPSGEQLKNFIIEKKKMFAEKLDGKPLDELSLRLNASDQWLLGEGDEIAKIRPGVDYNIPRYGKVDYGDGVNAIQTYDTAKLSGAVDYHTKVQQIKDINNVTFSNFARENADQFPDAPDWNDPNRIPTRSGAGASLFGFANSNYGTVGGWAQFVGTLTNTLKLTRKEELLKSLNPAIASVALSKELTAEAALINNRLLQSDKAWVINPMKGLELIPREDLAAVLKNGKPSETIKVSSPELMDFWKTHANLNGERQQHIANMKSNAGFGDDHDYNVIYPIPVSTTQLKHFVLVKPIGITSGDKSRIIAAKDVDTLIKLTKEVDTTKFRVLTKEDSADFHKAVGDYEYSLGFNESAVDSSLKREGKLSQHFPTIDSGFLERVSEWHQQQSDTLVTKMVHHKYSQTFEELQNLGKEHTNFETSQFRKAIDALAQQAKDPYNDIVKTALDISRASEYQWWKTFNQTVKESIEGPINKLRDVFSKTKDIDQEFLGKVNSLSSDLGLGTPYQTAHSVLLANKNVPDKPWLTQGIAKAQGLMSSTLLQWDFFNAVNNVLGSPIISSPEMRSLFKAITAKANPEQLASFNDLMSVKAAGNSGPEGLPMFTTAKLQRNALQNMMNDTDGVLQKRFQSINVDTDAIYQMKQMTDSLAFNFTESAGQVDNKLTQAAAFARKWTGNTLAEHTTRFMAADIARQITDFAVETGVLKSVKEANEYIQLFVNRTQGNYLYSQRPVVFQGVVGQAISLFQTYQFNLMQQLFRYVGEGENKNLAMLLGLQGSIYGMQGLPAFNFINTHIVGNAAGNTQHKDLYQASNSVFGKTLGDWILYGAGSNALGLVDAQARFNLYSRGDINPRSVTVLPTQISDVPVVAASVKFVGNLFSAGEKLAAGGSLLPTLSQALEHNGLSRPLAGLAQIAQGYTTTNQGSLLSSSQDFVNIAQATRILGGKPFDEAVALDVLYRINAYKAKDLSSIQKLGSAIKTTTVGGGVPSEQEITNFATSYAKYGGKIENFNKFMSGVMLNSNRSQVNKIAENLQNPFSKQMQIVMGGKPLEDFTNSPEK